MSLSVCLRVWYMHHVHSWCLWRPEGVFHSLDQELQVIVSCHVGIAPGSSVGAPSSINHWAISPAL